MPVCVAGYDFTTRPRDRIVESQAQRHHLRQVLRFSEGSDIPHRAGHVLCPPTVTAFLAAGRRKRCQVAHEQYTDPGWPAAFVSRDRDEVGMVDDLPIRPRRHLRRIHQQQPSRRPDDVRDCRDRLPHACFAIGILHTNQRSFTVDQ
jgi:hypothetical protein